MTIHSAHWGAFHPRVEDGRLVAADPFAADRDPSELLHSVPGAVHARNRVVRPAVRSSWWEGRRGRRGADPFVEVDWDTALDLVADALRSTYDRHGAASVYGGSYGWSSAGRLHHAKTQLNHFLACAGGYTGYVTNYSYGAAERLLPYVVGDAGSVTGCVASWDDIAGCTDTILMLGGAPAKNLQLESGGTADHTARVGLQRVLDAGTQIINVNPVRSDAPEHPGVTWVPIRPSSDTALLLALMHELDERGRVDRAFLDRCTVGWPRLRAYVRGETDGVAKTPRWAEAVTGVPAATTQTIADRLAAGRSLVTATWALQRAEHGEQPYWAVIALAACLGQIGLPGGGFGFGYGSSAGVGAGRRPFGTPAFRARRNPCDARIPVARLTDLLSDPGGSYEFDGAAHHYPDIRLVYWAGGKTTTLERDDIAAGSLEPYVVAMKQAVAPQGEARNDRQIFAALAERLGCWKDYTDGQDDGQALCAMYERARESAAEHGHVLPDFAAFWERGYYRYELPAAPPPFAAFRADPERAPLATASGRIELFSETVHGYGYAECPGHPVWIPPAEWLGASAAQQFPIHLLSPQPASRLHSQLDMAGVSAESKIAGREPVVLSGADAAERGVVDGDVVRIWNDRGETYAGAVVRDDVLRGVALLATGAWYTPRDLGAAGPELHGNPNVLTRTVPTSRLTQGATAQSVLVQVEKAPPDAPYRDPHGLPDLRPR